MRPVDFKDDFYDRDPLSSNNDLYGVVKPFYCFDEQNKRIDKCGIQCTTCKDLKLMK